MRHGGKVSLFIACLFCALPAMARSEAPVAEVSQALEDLHSWLGDDANARNWRAFLRSDDLVAQLSKGNAADLATVQEIRAIYGGSETGLDLRRFAAMRSALDKWIKEPQTPISDLPAAVRAAKESFRPISAQDVSRARAELLAATNQLERFLRSSGADNTNAWKKLVDWDALQRELAKSDAPKPEELERIAALYRADHAGLEAAPFAAVRHALQNYAQVLRFSADAKLQTVFAENIDELAKRLEALSTASKTDDLTAAGRALGWLERAGQARQVVAATRGRFQRPNLFAVASRKFIEAGFDDPETKTKLNQPRALNDNILGTQIHGTVYPNLELSLLLVPSEEQATINIQLNGAATSQNVGYRGPVTVWTSGYTQIAASKHIFLDADGITSSVTAASCSTSSNIHSIAARCGLIEKVAWKQAGKQKGQAERVASALAESRIAGQVDSEVNNRLAEAHQSYLEKIHNRLVRKDSFPQLFKLSSTEEAVLVRILHATPNQLATPTDPPALSGDHDLAVRLHETAVMNFGESLLGGETLSDERLVEILDENKIEVPEELKITPDKDPWSITFTLEQPVLASFADNGVKLAIRGRRFTRGDQVVRENIEISADYKLEKTDTGSKLTRQGEVSVEYVTRKQLSLGQVAMKTFLRKKFDALFKEEITSDGPKLPGRFKTAGKLQLRQLNCDLGWLTLGWEQLPVPAPPQVAIAD